MFVPNTLTMGIAFILNTNIYPQAMGFASNIVTLLEKKWPNRVWHVLICCCGRIHDWKRVRRTRQSHLTSCAKVWGATTRRQWDDQTLTIGAYAIEEIFLPFRQAHGNSAAISTMLWYHLRIPCAADAGIQATGNPRPDPLHINHPPKLLRQI